MRTILGAAFSFATVGIAAAASFPANNYYITSSPSERLELVGPYLAPMSAMNWQR